MRACKHHYTHIYEYNSHTECIHVCMNASSFGCKYAIAYISTLFITIFQRILFILFFLVFLFFIFHFYFISFDCFYHNRLWMFAPSVRSFVWFLFEKVGYLMRFFAFCLLPFAFATINHCGFMRFYDCYWYLLLLLHLYASMRVAAIISLLLLFRHWETTHSNPNTCW